MKNDTVVVAGLNDAATATAIRFFRAGIPVILWAVEEAPPDLFMHRNFGNLPVLGRKERLGITARTFADYGYHIEPTPKSGREFVLRARGDRIIPCLNTREITEVIKNGENMIFCCTSLSAVPGTGEQVYAVEGCSAPNVRYTVDSTGMVLYPFLELDAGMAPFPENMVLTAPEEGVVQTLKSIGDKIRRGEPLLQVGRHKVSAGGDGVVCGMVASGSFVEKGTAVGMIAEKAVNIERLPVESWAVAGAFLELYYHEKKLK